jgi:hypothetical protein
VKRLLAFAVRIDVFAKSLEKLAVFEVLTVNEVAARCIITGNSQTCPAFNPEDITAY